QVTREVLTALSFMHNQGVVHKDLKPENILFVDVSEPREYLGGPPRATGNVKVIDFGLAELFGTNIEKSMNVAGTAFYMAPEIFRPPFDYKCDIWSLGVILYLLLTGYLPFFGSSVSEVKSNVLYKRVQWPDYMCNSSRRLRVPKGARDLVEKMLAKDPLLRESAADLLNHRWLRKFSSGNGWRNGVRLLSGGVVDCICYYARQSELKKAIINLIAH
ncbi:Serine/threonine-protein kinase 33, partial [Perkinsus olseni]